jgi:hypothetical protein
MDKTLLSLLAIVVAGLLGIIALNLSIQTVHQLSSAEGPRNQAVVEQTRTTVLPVVAKVYVDQDRFGIGSAGFVVQDGQNLRFVRVDKGSRMGKMKTPKLLLSVSRGGEKESIQPLFPDPLVPIASELE